MLSDGQAVEQLGWAVHAPQCGQGVGGFCERVSDSEWQPRESHSWAARPPQTDWVMGWGRGGTRT